MPAPAGAGGQEPHLPQALARLTQQHRGRHVDILLIEALHFLPQVGSSDQVGAGGRPSM
jgi:hypothetical protein